MRTAFINQLIVEARANPRLFVAVGDLGYAVVEPFAAEFPDRFLNVGVAEQNMTGIAAGLASEGYHVFTYSIANFPTLRCLEQIRNDICYHGLPVTVVAVGAGLAYGNQGYSHHAVQDIAVMRTLPGLRLLSPADPGEAVEAVSYLSANPGPSYLRLGKAGERNLYEAGPLTPLPALVLEGSRDVAIAATGSILSLALEAAAAQIAAGKVPPTVFSMPWIHPAGEGMVKAFKSFKHLICLEEHIPQGGLREMLAGLLPRSVHVSGLALPPEAMVVVGSQSFLRESAGLTVSRLLSLINKHQE